MIAIPLPGTGVSIFQGMDTLIAEHSHRLVSLRCRSSSSWRGLATLPQRAQAADWGLHRWSSNTPLADDVNQSRSVAGRGAGSASGWRYRTLARLHGLGLVCRAIRFEVRPRKDAGVWVMARGLGNAIAHGRTLTKATVALIRILAPDG